MAFDEPQDRREQPSEMVLAIFVDLGQWIDEDKLEDALERAFELSADELDALAEQDAAHVAELRK